MWFIYKTTPSTDKLELVTTADNIDECNDRNLSEGGHPAFYAGKWFTDCKRCVRLGDALYEVKYCCGARIYKVYGNLWVCMDTGGHQIKLGTFEECEDHLYCYGDIEDIAREAMYYKGQFENCTYKAVWEEPKPNAEFWDEIAFIPKDENGHLTIEQVEKELDRTQDTKTKITLELMREWSFYDPAHGSCCPYRDLRDGKSSRALDHWMKTTSPESVKLIKDLVEHDKAKNKV